MTIDNTPLCQLTLKFVYPIYVDEPQIAQFKRGLEKLADIYLGGYAPKSAYLIGSTVTSTDSNPNNYCHRVYDVEIRLTLNGLYGNDDVMERATIRSMHQLAEHLLDMIILPIPVPCLYNIRVSDRYGNAMEYSSGRGPAED